MPLITGITRLTKEEFGKHDRRIYKLSRRFWESDL